MFTKQKYTPLKQGKPLASKSTLNRGTSTLKVNKRLSANRKKTKVLHNGDIIWSQSRADSEFSKEIIKRDQVCQKCGTDQNLTCSHFVGRSHKTTRFDPQNCIALCINCHTVWETEKQFGRDYYEFMVQRLGAVPFMELIKLGEETGYIDVEIKGCMMWVQLQRNELAEIEY